MRTVPREGRGEPGLCVSGLLSAPTDLYNDGVVLNLRKLGDVFFPNPAMARIATLPRENSRCANTGPAGSDNNLYIREQYQCLRSASRSCWRPAFISATRRAVGIRRC